MARKKQSAKKSGGKSSGAKKRKAAARPPTPAEIHARLDGFLKRRLRSFDLSEAQSVCGPAAVSEDVAYALATRPDLVSLPSAVEELRYQSRQGAFRNAQFKIKLTPSERKHAFLIPGHRYVPFVSRLILPTDVTILDTQNKPLPMKTVELSYKDMLIYLTFFSEMERFDYLERQGVRVHMDTFDPEAPVPIQVVDLSSLSLADGVLLLEVQDWMAGIVKMVPKDQEFLPLDFAGASDWLARMTYGLETVFEIMGPGASVDDQLAHAIALGEVDLQQAPPMHIAGILGAQQRIRLVHSSPSHTCLWDGDIEDMADFGPGRAAFGGPDELSRTLTELSLAFDRTEIEGLMRNAAFHGQPRKSVIDLVLAERPSKSAAAKRLKALMTDLWAYVEETGAINQDLSKASLRMGAVELILEQVNLMRSLDLRGVDPNQLPVEPVMEFSQLSQMLNALIQLTNAEGPIDPGASKEMLKALENGRARFDAAIAAIEDAVSDMPDTGTKSKDAYQLRISLRYVEPEVWRRVVVPASISLDELHDVIQCAMGWEDDHLHEFVIKRQRFFGAPAHAEHAMDPGDGSIFEDGVILEQLVSKVGTKFRYLYDFGDGWEHELQLEKIHRGADELTVRCLAGENACPPEDIGGPPGYHMLREALADAKHPRRGEYEDWYEGFDATAFDLKAVNQQLAQLEL